MFFNFTMNFYLAISQIDFAFRLESVHQKIENNQRIDYLKYFSILFEIFAFVFWITIANLSNIYKNDTFYYIFVATLMLFVAIMMNWSTLKVRDILVNKLKTEDFNSKRFLLTFASVSFIVSLQVIYLYAYSHINSHLCTFGQYTLQNNLDILWDVPIIIIICHLHRKQFDV